MTQGMQHSPAPGSAQRNQCDGCARGLPIVNGIHHGPTAWDRQRCTADRYAAPASDAVSMLTQVLEAVEWAASVDGFAKDAHCLHAAAKNLRTLRQQLVPSPEELRQWAEAMEKAEIGLANAASYRALPDNEQASVEKALPAARAALRSIRKYAAPASEEKIECEHGVLYGRTCEACDYAAPNQSDGSGMDTEKMARAAREHGMDLEDAPVAYEFFNRATGHAIVDYTRWTHAGHLTEKDGYEARPLVYATTPPAAPASDASDASDAVSILDSALKSKTKGAERGHRKAANAFVTYEGTAADLNELARYVDRLESAVRTLHKVRDWANRAAVLVTKQNPINKAFWDGVRWAQAAPARQEAAEQAEPYGWLKIDADGKCEYVPNTLITVDLPKNVAVRIPLYASLPSTEQAEPMHMTLCEFGKLLPRPNQTYIAVHIPGCEECDRMAAQQKEAYGASSPVPNEDGSLSAGQSAVSVPTGERPLFDSDPGRADDILDE